MRLGAHPGEPRSAAGRVAAAASVLLVALIGYHFGSAGPSSPTASGADGANGTLEIKSRSGAARIRASSRPASRYRFVSTADAWNNDIGDVRKASGWDPGEPNSINRSWRRAIDAVLSDIGHHEPRFVLVAGDLVAGRWDDDLDGVAIFGETSSLSGQREAVREAAGIYYRQWRAQFRRHGLRVHPAVGDHEIGDDDDSWTEAHEQALVPTYRNAWSRAFTYRRTGAGFRYPSQPPRGTQHAGTAYAFRSGPAFLVTVDVFHQQRDGSVRTTIVGSQLEWLRRVLRAADANPSVRFIVVQGHTPVLPAKYAGGSSGLRLDGGSASPFWRTLERNGVDVYLCGEAHAISRANHGGVEQVTHGSNLGFGPLNYLTVAVSPQRLWLTLRRAPVRQVTDNRLWQSGWVRPLASRVVGQFSVVGSMSITADGHEQSRRGMLRLPHTRAARPIDLPTTRPGPSDPRIAGLPDDLRARHVN